MTKTELENILNIYQNYYNDFRNISKNDLNKLYFEIAKSEHSIKEIKKEIINLNN